MLGTVARTWTMESLNHPSISSFKGRPDAPNWLRVTQSKEKEKQNLSWGVRLEGRQRQKK